jgi:uncharacterized alkaline shock family protein YloU
VIDQPAVPPSPSAGALPAGRTVIGDPAAAKIAAIAARAVPGVHSLGPGAGRALGAIRDAVGGNDLSHGVKVEVGQTQLAVDVSLVAEYGFALGTLADTVRAAVHEALTDLVGLEVVEVNVEILDVHLPQPADARSPEVGSPAPRLTESVPGGRVRSAGSSSIPPVE